MAYTFETSHFSAYQDERGIYHLIFHDHSPQATAYWYEYLTALYDITPEHHTLLFLVKFEGALPARAMIQYYFRKLQKRYPAHCATRSVVLYRYGFFTRLVNAMVRIVPSDHRTIVQLFPQWKQESAISWLLQEREKDSPATSSA